MKPNTLDIAGRLADFFARQILVLEEMRVELPQLQEIVDASIEEAAIDFHKRREQALAILAKEFELLKREWDETEGITADERAQVESLSRRAHDLIEQVQPLLAKSVANARGKMAAMEASMTELRRGRQVTRAYQSRDGRQGSGLDRQG